MIQSFAMVLCASAKEKGTVEIVDPPAGSAPGDRVYFEGLEDDTALELLNPKKKIFGAYVPRTAELTLRRDGPARLHHARFARVRVAGSERRVGDSQDPHGQGRLHRADAHRREPVVAVACIVLDLANRACSPMLPTSRAQRVCVAKPLGHRRHDVALGRRRDLVAHSDSL